MNPAFRRLTADLPPRGAPDPSAFPSDPKRVRAWVDALPRANQIATLRSLSDAMDALQTQRLEGTRRLDLMELLRPAVMEGIGYLDKQLQNSSFPLPESRRLQADQIGNLFASLMMAYRLALIESCAASGNVPFMRGGSVALCAQRAVIFGSRLLRHGYHLYRGPLPGVWECLHAVHEFAQLAGVQDKLVSDGGKRKVSVRQTYTHALLLAVSNPYRFSQKEQDDIWAITAQLSLHCPSLTRNPVEGAIAVPYAEDAAPGYVSEEREAEGGLRWFDIGTLRRALDGALSSTLVGDVELKFRGSRAMRVPHEIAQKLRQGWGQASERSHSRLGAGHKLDTVIGLSGLHFHLSGGVDFDSFLRNLRLGGNQGGEGDRAAWAHGGSEMGRSPLLPATVLDQSLGGYRMTWAREVGVKARVGELVGLSPAADPDLRTWMVGVIRWLRYNHDGSVDAGIELLARRAEAVGLRSIDLIGNARAPLRGIQIQSLRPTTSTAQHFLAPSVLDVDALQLEVSGLNEPVGLEHPEPRIERLGAVTLLENAGDYVLLNATRASLQ
jgi:hypothetical protein